MPIFYKTRRSINLEDQGDALLWTMVKRVPIMAGCKVLELGSKQHPLSNHVVSGTIPIPIPILGGSNYPLSGSPPLTMPECIGIWNWERSRIPNSNSNSSDLEFGIVSL